MLLKMIVQTYLAFVTVTSLCLATTTTTTTVQPVMIEPQQNNLTSMLSNISEYLYNYNEEFIACVKIMVAAKHYEVLENNSVYVPIYNELYDSRNYFINNGSLFICSPSKISWYQEHSVTKPQAYYAIGSILTVVFLILSCVCLGLHLCIFIIVPEYKTLTGKNTASIAVCLLLAYSLFLAGGSVKNTDSCPKMAAAIFYFFLSSFFWMNSFAFDVWLSLNTSIKKLNNFLNKTKESVRYLIYACYSFGIPMIIVGAAVIVDAGIIGGDNDFIPVFNRNSCWFQSYKSFIVFFITPYVTLTILDVILFVLSIATIAKLKIADGKHEFSPKRRFILCMRLAAATGMPWFVGIIAMLAQWEPLWYLFIVTTTLQGVYIFVAYNCNGKTVKYLLAAVRKGGEKSPSTSTVKSASSPV